MLKMVCDIYRETITEASGDDYGNFSPDDGDDPLYSSVKCYINKYVITSSKFNLNVEGWDIKNLYLGNFKKDQDVKVGDKIVCSEFDPSTLYVVSVNPVHRATTGKKNHKLCLLSIEEG